MTEQTLGYLLVVSLVAVGAVLLFDAAVWLGTALYRLISGERHVPRYRGEHRKGRHRA